MRKTQASTLLADPSTYASGPPHDEFARLRAEEPVSWVNEVALHRRDGTRQATHRGDGFWAVTRHAAVTQAAKSPEIFSSALGGPFLTDAKSPADLQRTRQLLVGMDAPKHSKLRRVASAAFTPRQVRLIDHLIAQHASDLTQRALEKEQIDGVADIAADLPLLVLADLLGMPREDRHLLFRWSNNLVGFDDPDFGGGDVRTFQRTFTEAFGYALESARARRANPGEDLVSQLVTVEVDGRRLTDEEYCYLWLLLVVAGNETSRHLIAGALDIFADDPAQAEVLLDPEGARLGVEELLRYITPIMQFRRTATQDTELDGQQIRAGDKLALYFISANRDDTVFPDASRLDLRRPANPHLTFGAGPHYCLGAALARAEGQAMLRALAPHAHRLQRTGPPQRLASNFMNGIKALPLTFA